MVLLARFTTLVLLFVMTVLAVPVAAEVVIEVHDPIAPARVTATAPTRQLADGPAVVLPFYRALVDNPSGETTLYAVRNNSSQPVNVRFSYYAAHNGALVLEEDRNIAAHAVRTVNVRSGANLPANGNGIAEGFMVAEALGGSLPNAVLSGDYFRVDPMGAAANGGALLTAEETACKRWSHRFFSGGGFDGGTQIAFLALDRPAQGPLIAGNVYDEAGEMVSVISVSSDQAAFEISDLDLDLPVSFGSIDWVFQGDSHGAVTTTFSAENLFSVGAEATCVEGAESEPPPDGAEVFELPGTFLTCRRCGNWQYDMPFASQRQFSKVIVDFDVFISAWDPNKPNGFHCLFWLNNGTQWQNMMGYMNSRGTQNRMVFQSNGPLGNPIGVERYASPGLSTGQSYHVHYEYDTVSKAVWYEVRTSSGVFLVGDLFPLPENVGPLSTNYTFIQFGSQPGGPAESLTEGWSWSNFRAQFIP